MSLRIVASLIVMQIAISVCRRIENVCYLEFKGDDVFNHICVDCATPNIRNAQLPKTPLVITEYGENPCEDEVYKSHDVRGKQVVLHVQTNHSCSVGLIASKAETFGAVAAFIVDHHNPVRKLPTEQLQGTTRIPLYEMDTPNFRYTAQLAQDGTMKVRGHLDTDVHWYLVDGLFQFMLFAIAVLTLLIALVLLRYDLMYATAQEEGFGILQGEKIERHRRPERVVKQIRTRDAVLATIAMIVAIIALFFVFKYIWLTIYLIYFIYLGSAVMVFADLSRRIFDKYVFKSSLSEQTTGQAVIKYGVGVVVGLSISVVWVFNLNKSYIWIVWNLLGMSICIFYLTTIIITEFLWLLILSIFLMTYEMLVWVFLHGDLLLGYMGYMSINSELMSSSTGRKVTLMIPMSFTAVSPELVDYHCVGTAMTHVLGMGVVLLPGLMVMQAARFGLMQTEPTKVYGAVAFTAYVLGIWLVFVVPDIYQETLLGTCQPALLFMLPVLCAMLLATAWWRKELSLFVHGYTTVNYTSVEEEENESTEDSEQEIMELNLVPFQQTQGK